MKLNFWVPLTKHYSTIWSTCIGHSHISGAQELKIKQGDLIKNIQVMKNMLTKFVMPTAISPSQPRELSNYVHSLSNVSVAVGCNDPPALSLSVGDGCSDPPAVSVSPVLPDFPPLHLAVPVQPCKAEPPEGRP